MKSVVFFLNSCSILQHGISLRVVFCINKIQSVQCVFQGSMWAWLIKNGDTKSRGTVSFIKVTDISTKLLSSRYPDQFLLVLSWSIPACVIRINSCLCYPDQFLLCYPDQFLLVLYPDQFLLVLYPDQFLLALYPDQFLLVLYPDQFLLVISRSIPECYSIFIT